jgi:hypothetical protein
MFGLSSGWSCSLWLCLRLLLLLLRSCLNWLYGLTLHLNFFRRILFFTSLTLFLLLRVAYSWRNSELVFINREVSHHGNLSAALNDKLSSILKLQEQVDSLLVALSCQWVDKIVDSILSNEELCRLILKVLVPCWLQS